MYNSIFNELTSKEFLYFLQLGEKGEVSDCKVISSGEHQHELLLILGGSALIERGGIEVAKLKRGQFIGEISFLTGQPASADVSVEHLKYIKWDQNKIKAIKMSNNSFWIKLNTVLTNDLTKKVAN